jgi:hypothetical protein
MVGVAADMPETPDDILRALADPLRRHLVDEGFLDRDHGRYWRTGGRVDL